MSDAGATFTGLLADATNSHDVERVADCFTTDYRNETPAHPGRGFEGRDQVRRNWSQIFTAVPDVTAAVLGTVRDGDEVWSEWEMTGHRVDGAEHLMRGVIIFGLAGSSPERARYARFYLEPVDRDGLDADHAVRRILGDVAP